MTDLGAHINYLFAAELQFRLASAARFAATMGNQPLDPPLEWSHGKHKVSYEELALRNDQADFAAWNMHRSATFLMAVVMKDAIKAAVPDPKNSTDRDIQASYQISRLIRNAFAHNPFQPVWSIDPDCRNRKFEVRDIVSLDTTNLQGVMFDWRHYGGPLAILRLCRYVRFEILKDQKRARKPIPTPKTIYVLQGNVILRKTNRSKRRK
ncbi:MAG: hypothetical protein CV090_07060 [Nitrospira sp. WS238]|nr:hypothetical protein [Nitrospira sp. WS238]